MNSDNNNTDGNDFEIRKSNEIISTENFENEINFDFENENPTVFSSNTPINPNEDEKENLNPVLIDKSIPDSQSITPTIIIPPKEKKKTILDHIKSFFTIRSLLLLVFSQFLSLMLTSTGICSTYLEQDYQVNIPTTQSTFHYFLLMTIYNTIYFVYKYLNYSKEKKEYKKYLQSSIMSQNNNNDPSIYLSSFGSPNNNTNTPTQNNFTIDDNIETPTGEIQNQEQTNKNSNLQQNNPSELKKPNFFRSMFKLNVAFWKYIILAFVDVEGNFLVVKAYQYTTITSIMLLDCFTIPCVMILSRIFLKAKYKLVHFAGVFICVGGLGILVYSDYLKNSDQTTAWEDVLIGDALCILGSVCYAISNVGQEMVVKQNQGGLEFLAMLGFFGFLINGTQLLIFERTELLSIHWNVNIILLLGGFAISLFLLYSLVPKFLTWSNATFMNLAFLTSDLFAIIANIFLFKEPPSWLFYISFVIIAIGLVIYIMLNLNKLNLNLRKKNTQNSIPSPQNYQQNGVF